jgi:hypothetical protein
MTTIANGSFENIAQIKYLETTVSCRNFIQEETKRKMILIMVAIIQLQSFVY